jgi:hypothetical protein
MLLSGASAKANNTISLQQQRMQQRKLEQPLLVHYTKDFKFVPNQAAQAPR